MDRVLIFGAGYSARAFAAMRPPGTAIQGTTRRPENFQSLARLGIAPLLFDGVSLSQDLGRALQGVTHLVVSAAPTEAGDPVLQAAGEALLASMPKLRWAGYLSTVGVYGDHDGGWVDENSQASPLSRRSILRVEAEQAWLRVARGVGVPMAVLRLAGIYGPGRNALVNLEKNTARRLIKPGQVFNRVHVHDIGAALWHLARSGTGGVFNVADDEPSPPQDVVTYAAKLMGVEPPPEVAFEAAELTQMARSFYSENKRVSNAAIRATGFAFAFPNYRAGLASLWTSGTWRGQGATDAASSINMS